MLATATRQAIPLTIQATGTVRAYSTVDIKPQISGQLMGVSFREGQFVQQGELMFTIDARSLQAAVAQAVAGRAQAIAKVRQAQAAQAQAQARVTQTRATVARIVAQAQNAEVQSRRYTNLLTQGAVSQEQADQFSTDANAQQASVTAAQSDVAAAIAAVESAKADVQDALATVRSADAAVSNAQVQLSYASIYAPIDGQVGKLNINQGNVVQDNGSTPIVTISQIQPIYVEFAIPQRQLDVLKTYQARGNLQVEVNPPQSTGLPIVGELVFVDSGVNATTGTIQLKARFTNADHRLTPGQFVNVVLKLAEEPNAIVVPAPAVQDGQKGSFIYVVKSDQTVEARPVELGQTTNNQTVITRGLQAGDRVVVDGQFNLTPGAKVKEQKP